MMSFSRDAHAADLEMRAVLFILVAFGHIDGSFDGTERGFIRDVIDELSERRADELFGRGAPERGDVLPRWKAHFYHATAGMEHEVQTHFTESVAEGESRRQFVLAKLKLRCFELLGHLGPDNRAPLLATVDRLMHVDGVAHPAERHFREELVSLLHAQVPHAELPRASHRPSPVVVEPPHRLPPRHLDHDFFRAVEQTRAVDVTTFLRHAAADVALMERFEARLGEQRARGQGRLTGAQSFAAFAGQAPFLDGHVHVVPPQPGRAYELLVVGDLHGCYSCLKAALLQGDFFTKLDAYRRAPQEHPEPFAVFLGDYID
ncbi:MAG: serine/threonine protein phosphatase, partial [Minicystis sp.]